MGKKQIIISEYDIDTGVVDVRYFGLSSRHEANKILIKTKASLLKTLMGGGFQPNQINDEKEVVTDERIKQGEECDGAREQLGEKSEDKSGDGSKVSKDRAGGISGTTT